MGCSGVQWGGATAMGGVLMIAVCACFPTFVCGRGWMCVYEGLDVCVCV